MNEVTIYKFNSGLADLLEKFITVLCEYILDDVQRNDTTRPIIYKLCEIYLQRNTEKVVTLVEVSVVYLMPLFC